MSKSGTKKDVLEEQVFTVIGDSLCQMPESIGDNLVDDLGADSLDMVEVVVDIEDKFDIEIPDDIADGFKTVGDVVNYVRKTKG